MFHRLTMKKSLLCTWRISLRTEQMRSLENGKTQGFLGRQEFLLAMKSGHEELCQSTVGSVVATPMSLSLARWP